jgi:hypothetical protein
MRVLPTATILSYCLAGLVTLASAAGLFVERIYALEQPVWAAQAAGQDIVNIIVAVPVLAISAHLAGTGSLPALLVRVGALVYLTYSYLLYAFFVHFGPLFPLYLVILSLSFHLLLGALVGTDLNRVAQAFTERTPRRLTSAFLLALGVTFVLLEGSVITGALVSGSSPEGAASTGLPVDPVHVLDLALLFPGMLLTALLLRRRRPLGYFLAGPLLVHMVMLGAAVIMMMAIMATRGFPASYVPMAVAGVSTASSLFVLARYLSGLDAAAGPGIVPVPDVPSVGG